MPSDSCVPTHNNNKNILHKHFFLSHLKSALQISRSWLISISIPLKQRRDPKKKSEILVFSAVLTFTKNVSLFSLQNKCNVLWKFQGKKKKEEEEIQMTHKANIQGYFLCLFTRSFKKQKSSNVVSAEFYYTFSPISTIVHYNFPIVT